jgi:hypothetical protein
MMGLACPEPPRKRALGELSRATSPHGTAPLLQVEGLRVEFPTRRGTLVAASALMGSVAMTPAGVTRNTKK